MTMGSITKTALVLMLFIALASCIEDSPDQVVPEPGSELDFLTIDMSADLKAMLAAAGTEAIGKNVALIQAYCQLASSKAKVEENNANSLVHFILKFGKTSSKASKAVNLAGYSSAFAAVSKSFGKGIGGYLLKFLDASVKTEGSSLLVPYQDGKVGLSYKTLGLLSKPDYFDKMAVSASKFNSRYQTLITAPVPENPATCCKATSAECLACAKGQTLDQFCAENPVQCGGAADEGDSSSVTPVPIPGSSSGSGVVYAKGRCGPKHDDQKCIGTYSGADKPEYCNEANGWCGVTDAHKNAQGSTKYDYIPPAGPEKKCITEAGENFRGPQGNEDVKRVDGVTSLEDCSALCTSNAQCTYYVYQKGPKRCWLKKNFTHKQKNGTCESGLKCQGGRAKLSANVRFDATEAIEEHVQDDLFTQQAKFYTKLLGIADDA